MEKNTKIAIGLGVAALVGFTLWRNYGVKPKDVVILNSYYGDSSKETSNEQKELIQKIERIERGLRAIPERTEMPKTLETSFGKYKYVETSKGGYWTKYAEVWENFANAAGSNSCVFFIGDELVNGKISSYDPNICVSGSQRGAVYSEQKRHDIL
jgi:hypothetical protein